MIFHALTLDGIGPYADRQRLDFGVDDRRPVTLVGGLNGAGKTTLIRSLFHVLYGPRSLAELGKHRTYAAYLEQVVNKERQDASLELALMIPGLVEGAPITVRRRINLGGRTPVEELDVFVEDTYDEQLSEAWDETIEQIAPLGVARLFFFDGEKIEALADLDSAADSLRTAVGSLLGLDLITQLQGDLVAVQRRVLRAGGAPSSAVLEERQQELDAASRLLGEVRRDLDQSEVQRDQANDACQRLRRAAQAAGGDLVEQRAELEAKVEASVGNEELARQRLRDLAANPLAPIALIPGLLEETIVAAERTQSNEVAREMLKVLTERDHWIVATAKKLDHKGADELEALLVDDRRSRNQEGETPSATPTSSPSSLVRIRDERLTDWRVEAIQSIDALDEAQRQTDEIDRMLSRIPHEDAVRMLLDSVQSSARRVAELDAKVDGEQKLLSAAQAKTEASRARRDAELARLADQQDAQERHERVTKHAELAKQTLGRLSGRIAARHVGRISTYTMQSLERLLRKDRLVEDVTIDPETFEVTLLGTHGILRPGALSAGERQLAALSLLWALARTAGLPLPVVIDTPLGRLDAGHRRHVIERYLPAASHQVVVLSTDTEIDGELLSLLRPALGAERRLANDIEGRTTIADGYLDVVTA